MNCSLKLSDWAGVIRILRSSTEWLSSCQHRAKQDLPNEKTAQQEVSMAEVDREQWLHMYEQMYRIRAFEEQVNELYQSAKMPGLAHLYIGEEAIAVGVCEALHRDDYITSTHRG